MIWHYGEDFLPRDSLRSLQESYREVQLPDEPVLQLVIERNGLSDDHPE